MTSQLAHLPVGENHLASKETTKINTFNNKIRRIVRASIDTMSEFKTKPPADIGLEGLPQIIDSSKSIYLRCAWVLMILICSSICLHQIYTCAVTYYDQPVAVDVEIREQEKVRFPSITFANTESDSLYEMWNAVSPEKSIDGQFFECLLPIRSLLREVKGITVEEMWNRLNTSETIVSLKLYSRNETYTPKMTQEFGFMGLQNKFTLDKLIRYGGVYTKTHCELRKIANGCPNGQIIFQFVNRRKDPCVDDETYYNCKTRCAIENFKNYTCRFPFLPKEIILPSCEAGSVEAESVYKKMVYEYVIMTCKCARQCWDTAFSIAINVGGKNKNITVVGAYFLSNVMTTIRERFAYDITSLMSDIGGSLGLCLGFSVLSIVQFAQGLIRIAKQKMTSPQKNWPPIFYEDPIVRRVHHLIRKELSLKKRDNKIKIISRFVGINTIMDSKASYLSRMIWLFLIAASFMSYALFVYIRLSLYLAESTRMKVEITKGDTVNFPNVTICGNHFKMIEIFRMSAKRKRIFRPLPSGVKMPNWCSFHLPDVLGTPGLDAKKLWDTQSVVHEFTIAQHIGEVTFGHRFMKNVSQRSVYLPDGTCMEYDIGEQVYAGTSSVFSKITLSKIDINMLNEEVLECDRSYNTVYLTPPNGTFLDSTRLIYPKTKKTILLLELKKETQLNLRRKPCSDFSIANECSLRCFENILKNSITCRLPYMPAFDNITVCTNPVNGRASQNAYMELRLTLDPFSHVNCSCVRSCTKSLISAAVYVEPMYLEGMTIFGIVYFSNIEQHFIEVAADNLSKLLCDLGGTLGLVLGLSLLSIFDMIQSFSPALLRIVCGKCNAKPKDKVSVADYSFKSKESSLRVIRLDESRAYVYDSLSTTSPRQIH